MSSMRRTLIPVAAALSLAAATSAHAATAPVPSAFALPLATPLAAETGSEPLAAGLSGGPSAPEPGSAWRPSGTTFESVRYRPRRRGGNYDYDDRPSLNSSSQLHAGFYDPSEGIGTGFWGGVRGGPWIDPHVQIGLGVDWFHKSEEVTESSSGGVPGPGGVVIVPERTVSEYSVNMFPIYGYMQVAGDASMSVIPYAGIGAGYNVLFLSARDFESGEEFDGTFGGWGWQLFGGAAVPLSGRSRMSGEVFYASTEVGRDTEDVFTGEEFRETIDVDGLGFRFGLSWGF